MTHGITTINRTTAAEFVIRLLIIGAAFAAISRADVAEFLIREIQRNTHIHEIVGITGRK